MKKRQLFLPIIALFFILCFPLSALSQVTLSVGDGNGPPGSSGNEVAISLENPDNLVLGVQSDICDVGDHLVITGIETTSRTEGLNCDFNELENGCARILIFSFSLEPIEKGSGPVLIVKYEVKESAPLGECRALNLENVSVIDEANHPLEVTEIPGEFCFTSCAVNISPAAKTVNSGETIQFSATNTGDCSEDPVYEWKVESEIGSAIDQYGLYTAGENTGDPVADNVIVTDTANHISITAYITVVGITTQCRINIQPSSQTVNSRDTIQFTASNTGDCLEDPVYEWNVESEIGSEIDEYGHYTAGENTGDPVTDNVIVTDSANHISTTAYITVVGTQCRINIQPSSQTVNSGDTIQFSATATGDCLEPDYVWEVESEIGSKITEDDGFYTAGYNDTPAPVTDLVTVYDYANSVSASVEIAVMLPSVRGSIKRISPEWILGSKWVPTQHYISITGKDTYFDNTSRLSFNPGYDIVHIANFSVEPNKIIAIILLNTDTESGYVDVTVTTGIEEPYTVTGDGMLRIY